MLKPYFFTVKIFCIANWLGCYRDTSRPGLNTGPVTGDNFGTGNVEEVVDGTFGLPAK
jgi:hypothetical protein